MNETIDDIIQKGHLEFHNIIYEVNLSVPEDIRWEYLDWLKSHISEMLKIAGFTDAKVWQTKSLNSEEGPAPVFELSVQYEIESQKDLDHYLKNIAPNMRSEGVKKFGDSVKIYRRILTKLR